MTSELRRGDRVAVTGQPGLWQVCFVTKTGYANLFRVDGPGSLRVALPESGVDLLSSQLLRHN